MWLFCPDLEITFIDVYYKHLINPFLDLNLSSAQVGHRRATSMLY